MDGENNGKQTLFFLMHDLRGFHMSNVLPALMTHDIQRFADWFRFRDPEMPWLIE